MPQAPTHGSSLTVLGGLLDGTTYSLGTSFEELLVGSDPGCHVHVDLPGVSPLHANLLVEASGVTVRDTRSPRGVFVNDDRVTQPTRLRDSDILWLGAPGEPSSVMLLCHVVALTPSVTVPVTGGSTAAEDDGFFVESEAAAAPLEEVMAFELAEPAEAGAGAEEVFIVDAAPAPTALPTPSDDDVFFVADEPTPSIPAPAVAAPPAPSRVARPLPLARAEEAFQLDLSAPMPSTTARTTPPDDAFVLDLPGDTPAQGVAPAKTSAGPTSRAQPTPQPPVVPEAALEFFVDDVAPAPAPPIVVPRPRAVAPAPSVAPHPVVPAMKQRPAAAPTPPASPSAPAAAQASAPHTAPAPVVPRGPRVGAGAAAQPAAVPVVAARPPSRADAPTSARSAPAPAAAARPAALESRPRTGRVAPATPAPRPVSRGRGGGSRGLLPGAALVIAIGLGGTGFVVWIWLQTPRLDGITPPRARSGEVVKLSGARFSKMSRALFGGQPGRVVNADAGTLEVEVPELTLTSGADRPVSVVVQNGSRTSAALTLQGYVAPRLHGIAPDVALPGEVVELAGSAFGADAQVQFGALPAEVLARSADMLRVRVPALDGPPGTPAPVRVTLQGVTSNEAPFFVGRLPLVLSVKPSAAAAGDVLALSGRGFSVEPGATQVRISGRPALLLSRGADALKVIVPWGVVPGAARLEVQVAGLETLAQASVDVAAPTAGIDFRFVAEPLEEAPDGSQVALSTELGPAFVLAAADGHTAAERAYGAQARLNGSAVAVKASLAAEFEARFTDPPVLGLRGKSEAVLEATPADAAAYTARGARPVSPARLAAWWSALARDLVLLIVRSERPQHAAALAGEGRALADTFQAGRRLVPFGLPRAVAESKGLRASLRGLALRVPNGVPEPALANPRSTTTAAALRLDGTWSGREEVPEGRRSIAVHFQGSSGQFSLEGGLSLSVPLQRVERMRSDAVRFSIRMAGGVRYYAGQWDGTRLRGEVSGDAGGRERLGTFELAPR